MYKLYPMNICLFIFLFHFVSNKESFFLKINDTEKIEFSLDRNSDVGKHFYQTLKANQNKPFISIYNDDSSFDTHAIMVDTFPELEGNLERSGDFHKGEIVFQSMSNFKKLYIYTDNSSEQSDTNFEIIGNIIQLKKLDDIIINFQANARLSIQFSLVVEEEDDTPKKMEKSGNWKTVKMKERVKALKRYRIVKRLEKLERLKKK